MRPETYSNLSSPRGGGSLARPVDFAALDPETRRLADRGSKEIFKASLADIVDAMHIAGEDFDETDLETVVVAGTLAEKADRIDASKGRSGRVVHAEPEGEALTSSSRTAVGSMAQPVDLAALDPEARRLADRGTKELLGFSLDRLVDNLKAAGEVLDQDDLDGLVLAGRMAEKIDSGDARSSE
jgi:hypothetical protein